MSQDEEDYNDGAQNEHPIGNLSARYRRFPAKPFHDFPPRLGRLGWQPRDRNWIGCREGILESVVERFFLVLTGELGAIVIVLMRAAFRIGLHLDFSDCRCEPATLARAREGSLRRKMRA